MATALVTLESNNDVVQLKPSYIKFLQGTTSDLRNGRPGQFYIPETGQAYDTLTCVLLDKYVNRAKYPANQTHGGGVLCKSYDGIVPADVIEAPLSDSCVSCRYQWEKNVDSYGRAKTRDLCKRERKLYVIVKETKLPHYLTCGGTSETAANKFLEMLYKAPYLVATQMELDDCPFEVKHFAFTVSGTPNGHNAKMSFGGVRFVETEHEFGPLYAEILRRDAERQVE